MFPDNTSQVWKLPVNILPPKTNKLIARYADIKWDYSDEGEFLQLAQLKDLLDEHGILVELTLTYLPYGRQDKEIDNFSTFALRTFAKLLNSLNFHNIHINDPHSQIALDLIKNSYAIYPIQEVENVIIQTKSDMICYPDNGASEKYREVYNRKLPRLHGEKIRDQLTGNIISYKLLGDPSNKNVLIVDDICDGGATFKILAKDLLAAGAKSVVLFVTHGIFSKGTRTLFESGIQRVFTKDGEVSERTGSLQF
jgi:ribose-phosphate pyrophosphokinase